MENTEWKWITQKIFSYQDPDTTVILNVLIDSGIIEDDNRNTYHSPRVLFQLKDNRSQPSKIQIELQFLELSSLVEQIKRVMDAGINNILEKKVNLPNYISVTKYGFKNKKDLVITFCLNQMNIPYVQLEISDPLGSVVSKSLIFIDIQNFYHLYNFCCQVRNSYANISISFLSALVQEKVLDEIRLLQNIRPIFNSVPKELVDIEDPITVSNVENTAQSYFTELGNKIFHAKIPKMEQPIQKENNNKKVSEEKIEKTEMPFIGTFLDYDPFKLNEWVSSFLCANEKSLAISFCPLNNIISRSIREKPFNHEISGFFEVQYFLDIMFKRSVTYYLKTGKFVSYPVFKMPTSNSFKPDTDIWELSEEILFCFMIYTNLYDCYFQYLNNNVDNQKHITEISIVQNFLKSYLSFFFMSMDMTNISEIKNDLLIILNKCSKNGFLNKINEFYSSISNGGQIDFSQRNMYTYISGILEDLNNIKTFSVSDVKKIFQENYINYTGQIKSIEEVKTLVTTFLNMENQKISDSRLITFISCIKKYSDPILLKQIEVRCKNFSDLNDLFREFNVGEEIIRIKRVMDRDPSLVHKSDILKATKELKEDPSVSETRVLFGDTVKIENSGVNVESVLNELQGDL